MNEISNTVDNMLAQYPNDFKMLSKEQLQQIVMATKVDEYKEQLKSHISKTKFDLTATISIWLSGKALPSQRMYSLYLNNFIQYLDGTSVLDVNFHTVDIFIANVLATYGESKRRLIIASLSSFYSLLERYEYIVRNPWKGARVKKVIAPPTKKAIPTDAEIHAICSEFSSESLSDRKMTLAITIMAKYGVRVGFFNKKYIQYDGSNINSVSKGKYYSICVGDDEIDTELLLQLNSNTIQTAFNRVVKKLGLSFSPHSLRHKFACDEYNKDKDLYRVSRKMGHSSTNITEIYLKGLGV